MSWVKMELEIIVQEVIQVLEVNKRLTRCGEIRWFDIRDKFFFFFFKDTVKKKIKIINKLTLK